jgi:amidase
MVGAAEKSEGVRMGWADQLHYLQLTELATLVRTREISPVEATQAQLERIAHLDPELGSYAIVLADRALAQAARAEAEVAEGRVRGPLHGVPVAVKDLLDVEGVPTRAGMPIRSRAASPADATVTARLVASGAVILGKLNLTEGAFSTYHPTLRAPLNPWDRGRYAGVSSSGNGVALAAGLCYGAIGSDTGGSIRFPSAANGVTGLKPTWGRVSRHGVAELAATLDHVGPMCRSAADTAAMLQVIAGDDPADSTAATTPVPDLIGAVGQSVKGIRIGVDRDWICQDVDGPTAAGVDHAIAVLASAGAEVVEIRFPDPSAVIASWFDMCAVQAAVAHEETFPAQRESYGPALAELIDRGRALTGVEYQRMILARADFSGRLAAVFDATDLLVMPAMAFVTPPVDLLAELAGEDRSRLRRFTVPFNMSGSPTITLPSGISPDGVPTAVQLVARHFDEGALVRAASAFQSETTWHRRHPAAL